MIMMLNFLGIRLIKVGNECFGKFILRFNFNWIIFSNSVDIKVYVVFREMLILVNIYCIVYMYSIVL